MNPPANNPTPDEGANLEGALTVDIASSATLGPDQRSCLPQPFFSASLDKSRLGEAGRDWGLLKQPLVAPAEDPNTADGKDARGFDALNLAGIMMVLGLFLSVEDPLEEVKDVLRPALPQTEEPPPPPEVKGPQ